jgi:FixJ family two-component response regulator
MSVTDDAIPLVTFIKDAPNVKEVGTVISELKMKENSGLLLPEPLLMEDKTRFVLFPIRHADVSF